MDPKAAEKRAWLRRLAATGEVEVNPRHLEDVEPLPEWLAPDAEAFEWCGRSRGENGYMRLEAIAAYCELVGIADLGERQRLMRLLLTVDARVVSHHRERAREGEQRGGITKPQSALLG